MRFPSRSLLAFAAAICCTASDHGFAQASFHTTPAAFAAALPPGSLFEFTETFEETTAGPNSVGMIPAPLQSGVPNTSFPAGLSHPGLVISATANPQLFLATPTAFGATSTVVGADFFVDTTILDFTNPNTRAVSLDKHILYGGNGMIDVAVFDAALNPIGAMTVPGGVVPTFLGITSTTSIGRITLAAQASGDEPVDNISTYLLSGVPFCFGDGSGTACPCGNTGAMGKGCRNSAVMAGAQLVASGTQSISSPSLVLTATGMPANKPCFFYQGTTQQSGGAGIVFGDGKRCAGGIPVLLGYKTTTGGMATFPSGMDPQIPAVGGIMSSGIRTYQVTYYDTAAFCTPSLFNHTNGVQVTWTM
jgi:hypothetical protein